MFASFRVVALSVAIVALNESTIGQCMILPGQTWGLPGGGPGVLSEVVRMRHWDPDGSGPLPPLVLMAGTFPPGPAGGSNLATWNPATGAWAPVGSWTFGRGQSCAIFPNGDLAVSAFNFALGQGAVARWNGSTWTQLGATFNGQVMALTTTPNGDLFAGGYYYIVGGQMIQSIARWDGAAWQPVGGGLQPVDELVTMPNGDIVAGGLSGVTRWNGTAWTTMNPNFICLALTLLPNGDLLAGGTSGALARWNSTTWTWIATPLGASQVRIEAINVLPNGDLFVAGQFALGPTMSSMDIAMRRQGTQWQLVRVSDGYCGFSLLGLTNGDVMISGSFMNRTHTGSVGLAQLTTTCPATVAPLGPGCPSSGGSNTVSASQAWTGGTWTTDATGLPPQAFVLLVNGFATVNTPLASLLPQGQPGCNLFVRPDHVALVPSAGGTASASFVIPNTPLLAGMVFHHQIIAVEHNAGLALVAATATNAATITVGTF